MRTTSPSREKMSLIRGRRILAAAKQKKNLTSSKTIKPKPVLLEDNELDKSFKACAYPSAVEIFKLSEQMDLPASKIKSEFQKRRQAFRQRHRLSEEAIIYSYTMPRIFLFFHVLCSKFNCTQETLIQVAVFLSSIISLFYAVYSKIGRYNYDQELIHSI